MPMPCTMEIHGKKLPDTDAVYIQRMLPTMTDIAAPVIAARTDWAAINLSALTGGLAS